MRDERSNEAKYFYYYMEKLYNNEKIKEGQKIWKFTEITNLESTQINHRLTSLNPTSSHQIKHGIMLFK
jgi:hypothetical protein